MPRGMIYICVKVRNLLTKVTNHGSDGFGYDRDDTGVLHKFQSTGTVVIEDNVDIGAVNCIDKGTLGDTVIGEGTKTDNFIHIAHNCQIGKNVCITAHVEISGSVVVGDGSYFAPCASVINGVNIGEGAFIGIGAVVTKDVPDGETWLGVPAREIGDFKAQQNYLRNFKGNYRCK